MDDTWIDDNCFVLNLEALLGDKLYNHDQRKMVQKVNMHKESEQKLIEIREEMCDFYYQFG